MQSTTPDVDAPLMRIAEAQPEFLPITAARVTHTDYPLAPGRDHNTLLLAFRPTDEERRRIAEGADVYVSLLTFGGTMPGVIVMAGKDEASAVFNVRATGVVPEPPAPAGAAELLESAAVHEGWAAMARSLRDVEYARYHEGHAARLRSLVQLLAAVGPEFAAVLRKRFEPLTAEESDRLRAGLAALEQLPDTEDAARA